MIIIGREGRREEGRGGGREEVEGGQDDYYPSSKRQIDMTRSVVTCTQSRQISVSPSSTPRSC